MTDKSFMNKVREVDSKRTQGEWKANSFCRAPATEKEKEVDSYKIQPIQHRALGSIDKYDAEFIALAPQMAEKLKAIDDTLKEQFLSHHILIEEINYILNSTP